MGAKCCGLLDSKFILGPTRDLFNRGYETLMRPGSPKEVPNGVTSRVDVVVITVRVHKPALN